MSKVWLCKEENSWLYCKIWSSYIKTIQTSNSRWWIPVAQVLHILVRKEVSSICATLRVFRRSIPITQFLQIDCCRSKEPLASLGFTSSKNLSCTGAQLIQLVEQNFGADISQWFVHGASKSCRINLGPSPADISYPFCQFHFSDHRVH